MSAEPGTDAALALDRSRPEPVSPSTSGTSAAAASRICQSAIQSPIAQIDALLGGFSNIVYRVSFQNEHPTVLFRFFGIGSEPVVDAEHENAMFMLLSLHGIAPSILAASFSAVSSSSLPGKSCEIQIKTSFGDFAQEAVSSSVPLPAQPFVPWRIEQFFAGRHFEDEERRSATALDLVVNSVQRMHRVTLQQAVAAGIPPCNRMLLMLERMLGRISTISSEPISSTVHELCAWVQHHVLLHQMPPLPYPLPPITPPLPPPRPLVICHNDLQVGNIIFNSSSGTVQLIDFEHSGPNMRAYDLSNFLCELCFTYLPLSISASGFSADFKTQFMPPSARKVLYATYATSWGDGAEGLMDELSDADVWVGVIASHVYWGVWGLLQVETCRNDDKSPMDFQLYSDTRFGEARRLLDAGLQAFEQPT